MNAGGEPANLEQLLARMEASGHHQDEVAIGDLLDAAGRRSFGPVVLLVGVILVTPLSGIPGLPTLMGLTTLLTLGQILFGRKSFWLPNLMIQRSIPRPRLLQAIGWLRPWARKVDRLVRPRFVWMVKGPGLYATVLLCMGIGAAMPLTEVVPFSSSIAGLALAVFGLSIVARDGLLAMYAWGIALMTSIILLPNIA